MPETVNREESFVARCRSPEVGVGTSFALDSDAMPIVASVSPAVNAARNEMEAHTITRLGALP
jgi:hypothetical protein